MVNIVVTQASDHQIVDVPAVRYCTEQEVLSLLFGVAQGDDASALGAWASTTQRSNLIDWLIKITRAEIEKYTGHDFEMHEDVDVRVDGTGGDILDVGLSGFWPLVDVTSITSYTDIDSPEIIDTANLIGYKDGRILNNDQTYLWPYGVQNIAITLSWGYTSYPEEIKYAQSLLCACRILSLVQAGDLNSSGVLGGAQSMEWNGFRITVPAGGRYAKTIAQFKLDADNLCALYSRPLVVGLNFQTAAERASQVGTRARRTPNARFVVT
jgi:hypothetical protein